MQIKQIFEKPIDRPIEGVIKADDDATLRIEVDEYVPTSEATKQLDRLFDAYLNAPQTNGVWISGFFGSGKSHLLKMLALLLENHTLGDGTRVLDLFLQKAEFRNEENGKENWLAADMKRAVAVPSESILFNIDQKADIVSKDQPDALLGVFLSVFNEHCGYFRKQAFIAQFERDLDRRNLLASFKQHFATLAGMTWEKGREEVYLSSPQIDAALAQANGGEVVSGIILQYDKTYKLSIEGFAELVRDYIQSKPTGFRLNFFVDEVGQYIASHRKLMLNLQTIAESLGTVCRGQSWLFVTAQEDLQDIVGDVTDTQGNDFTRIQERFKTLIKLTSRDVDEVIQRRLLWKKGAALGELTAIYEREKNNFKTLLAFGEGSTTLASYADAEDFVATYPFINYQFTLFQNVMRELSGHGAFTGKYTSVGARSMLGVFQQAAIAIGDKEVGAIAPFGMMFEGIRAALKTQVQNSVLIAEDEVHDPFAIQLLKALLLVKYVGSFKATERNLTVLMLEGFDQNIAALQGKLRAALAFLEQQTWIMRNGEVWTYLTDEEKDIEQDIKLVEVADSELATQLSDLFFNRAIGENKFRRNDVGLGNGQDFAFTRKLDDQVISARHELGVHIVSPQHERFEDHPILISQSMGRDELLVILPADLHFRRELRLYVQTDRYVKHNTGSVSTNSRSSIVAAKGTQNIQRMEALRTQALDLLVRASLYVEGTAVDPETSDARSRIQRAFWTLVERTYPKLAMLRGVQWKDEQIAGLLKPADGLYGGDESTFSEAEREILGWILLNKANHQRVTMQLAVSHFSRKPYGWPLTAIQANVAKLLGRGKLEARLETALLADRSLEQALLSTRQHANLDFDPVPDIPAAAVSALRTMITQYFATPPSASEPKAMALEAQQLLREVKVRFETIRRQSVEFPFLATVLDPALRDLQKILDEPWGAWFSALPDLRSRLYTLKEQTLDPIREFMEPPRQKIYADVRDFLNSQSANFDFAARDEAQDLRTLIESPEIYRGQNIQQAKMKLERARGLVESAILAERNKAINAMERQWTNFAGTADFRALSEAQRDELNARAALAYEKVNKAILIGLIQNGATYFTQQSLPEMAAQAHRWTHPAPDPMEGGDPDPKPVVIRETVSIQGLFIPAKPLLETAADVEAYLDAARAVLLKEVHAGKRISIH